MSQVHETGTFRVKRGLAEMLKGGVIMDVVTPDQAKIAEDAGASAVMALERVPFDIRRDGGVARMSDPEMIEGIKAVVTIPVMAKARIGHPADAALVMQLGAQAVFVGSGIFKSDNPALRAKAIVEATTHFQDAEILAKVSRGLGEPMKGLEIDTLDVKLAERGW